MTDILVGPKFCKIENENNFELLSKLDKHLSFRYVGAEFTPAFKYRGWDGREYLLSKKLEFMTGLLEDVKEFYAENGLSPNIIELRETFCPGQETYILPKLKEIGITPYDYQLSAIDKALKNDRVIFKHATGSGKSITAALITAKIGKPTIIYVISKELLFQFHENFSNLFGKKIGIVGAGLCDIQDITIISIWTLGRMLGLKKNDILVDDYDGEDDKFSKENIAKVLTYIKNVKIHMFDECHVAAAKTIQNIYKKINPEKLYGFSGTPVRDDGAEMLITGIFGNVIDEVPASELIRRKILAKPFIKFIYVKGYAHFTEPYPQVYSNNIINNDYRNNIIMNEAKKLVDKNYQVLVLYKNINHGKKLLELFEKNNVECEILNGKDSEAKRKSVKQDLLDGKLKCLIASMIYDIGIDIPTLNALILAGAGKSSVKTLQRIGRVIRNGSEKPFAAVVEFFDDVRFLKKHSRVRQGIYETEQEFEIKMPIFLK